MADNIDLILHKAVKQGVISGLAHHFYDFFKRLDPAAGELVWLSGMLAVQLSQEGHSCLNLSEFAGRKLFAEEGMAEWKHNIVLPQERSWADSLLATELVGSEGAVRPLILDGDRRLYLHRFWDYETRLAAELNGRAVLGGYEPEQIAPVLKRLFPDMREETDWQKVAAATAALRRITVISGGPGTGKTHIVLKIIALLQLLARPKKINIGLAAPTGKAASRLQESIIAGWSALEKGVIGIDDICLEARTIHRLLGVRPHSSGFRHHKANPLKLDVLIVDEASMVDLALMTKLIEAMPPHGRLVLLGDKEQLSSVEAGRVLADICGENRSSSFSAGFADKLCRAWAATELVVARHAGGVADSTVLLSKSYRFAKDSGIGKLSEAVLNGDVEEAFACFDEHSELNWLPPFQPAINKNRLLLSHFRGSGFPGDESEVERAFASFDSFQILCVRRHGDCGVAALNSFVEASLEKDGLLARSGEWYPGRPLMITGNHYNLELFNGDIGITLCDPSGKLRVFFRQGESFRSISPARIPAHETAFAMTVHKSQGSEFDHVVLVVPDSSRVLSRELIYTAITRAKVSFDVYGPEAAIEKAIVAKMERSTGLAKKLRC